MSGPNDCVWTQARIAYLQEHYPAGMSLDDMHAALSAMPGRSVVRDNIPNAAARYGVHRPQAYCPDASTVTPYTPPDELLEPVYADGRTVAQWAAAQRLGEAGKVRLSEVNAVRRDRGLPPFAVARDRGGSVGWAIGR